MNKSKIIIKAPGKIDLTEFKKDKSKVTKYGLPKEVKFCKKCVISNQRPNTTVEFKHTEDSKKTTINFNEDGVCDACVVTEKKNKNIDWEKRKKELIIFLIKYRRKSKGPAKLSRRTSNALGGTYKSSGREVSLPCTVAKNISSCRG